MRHSTAYRCTLTTFIALLLTCLAGVAWAKAMPVPQPPRLPVRGYILEDFHSGQVLAEVNADERLEPASITKLMSGYVVYKALKDGNISYADTVTISEKAWRMEGSRMFVEVGKQVSVEDLLRGMVIQSGNDATVALAEHVAGTENAFATLMNQQAQLLGMTSTHFVNSTGLPDPDHYTTARDIAILTRALIKVFPEQYQLYAERSYTYNDITQHNRNRLLWQDESVDGVKTGHTRSAGYCLVSSAKRGDTRLISVVLGAENEKNRFSASQALLNYGFRFYETYKLYAAAQPLVQARVWKGEIADLPLGLAEDLFVTIPKGRYNDMDAVMKVITGIEAPVDQGAVQGAVTVTLDDALLAEAPLVALQAVPEGGLFTRLVDQAQMLFKSFLE